MTTATESDLHQIIRLLPGYDPYTQSEGYYFDPDAAQLRINFIEVCCTFTQGVKTGQPFLLEDWEKAIVANLYGWKSAATGMRRYSTAFIMVGRGNGKSELQAALICVSLYLPDDPDEPGGHIFSAAGKKDQTRYIFDPVCAMVRACPEMRAMTQIYKKTSVVAGGRSYIPMARETHAGTGHGGAVMFAAVDELHAHLDRKLLTSMETGMAKRKQPLMVITTTSDSEREDSPCNHAHDYASKVRDGLVNDPTYLPAIYEADKEDDFTDEATWLKANPNFYVTFNVERFKALVERAKADPAFRNDFRRLYLNIRTQDTQALIDLKRWDACQGELPDLAGEVCYAGLDIGAVSDLTALVQAFRLSDEKIALRLKVWVPEDAVNERAARGDPTYRNWVDEGLVALCPGHEVAYDEVEAEVLARHKETPFVELAMDRLFQGAQMLQDFEKDHGLTPFAHGQGTYGMAGPTRTFMELVNTGKIVHDGNPVLRWFVNNLVGIKDTAGNWTPSKKHSKEKIDGAVAAIMAVGRAAVGNQGRSIYEDENARPEGFLML